MGSRNGGDDGKEEMVRNEEEEDYDPEYTLFLQNLKASSGGTAYVLEIERGNATKIVKYEDKDEDELQPSYECKRKLPVIGSEPREAKSQRVGCSEQQLDVSSCRHVGGSTKGDERNDGCESSRIGSEYPVVNGRSEGLDKEKGKRKRGGHVVSRSLSVRGGRLNGNPSMGDEDCKFQGNVASVNPSRGRKRGRPPGVSKRSAHGFKDKDELQGGGDGNPSMGEGDCKFQGNVASVNPSRGRKRGRPPGVSKRSAHGFKDKDELQGGRKIPELENGDPPESRRSDILPRGMKSVGIGCGSVQGDGISCRHVGESSKSGQINTEFIWVVDKQVEKDKVRRGRLNGNPPGIYERSDYLGKGKKLQTLDPNKIEKSYYKFLKKNLVSGKTRVCRGKGGMQYNYYEPFDERRSKSDAKGPPGPPPSSGRRAPQPSNKRLAPSDKRVPPNQADAGLHSEFRQGAMDLLLKPYDKKELVDLGGKATLRKPHWRTRRVRGQEHDYYDESTMGRSLLDHHIDLRKIIKHAQRDDPHKVLLLLRGFIYYAQRTCTEGQFKPWNDKLWLEAMNIIISSRNQYAGLG